MPCPRLVAVSAAVPSGAVPLCQGPQHLQGQGQVSTSSSWTLTQADAFFKPPFTEAWSPRGDHLSI